MGKFTPQEMEYLQGSAGDPAPDTHVYCVIRDK